jgi:hypothetical protein
VKSNLKRPLKFRILVFNSPLPKAAMDVASVSKQLLVLILATLEKTDHRSWIRAVSIVSHRRLLLWETGVILQRRQIGLLLN